MGYLKGDRQIKVKELRLELEEEVDFKYCDERREGLLWN